MSFLSHDGLYQYFTCPPRKLRTPRSSSGFNFFQQWSIFLMLRVEANLWAWRLASRRRPAEERSAASPEEFPVHPPALQLAVRPQVTDDSGTCVQVLKKKWREGEEAGVVGGWGSWRPWEVHTQGRSPRARVLPSAFSRMAGLRFLILTLSWRHFLPHTVIIKWDQPYPCLDILADILKMYIYIPIYSYTQIQLFSLTFGLEGQQSPRSWNKEHVCHLLDTQRNSKDFSTGRGGVWWISFQIYFNSREFSQVLNRFIFAFVKACTPLIIQSFEWTQRGCFRFGLEVLAPHRLCVAEPHSLQLGFLSFGRDCLPTDGRFTKKKIVMSEILPGHISVFPGCQLLCNSLKI